MHINFLSAAKICIYFSFALFIFFIIFVLYFAKPRLFQIRSYLVASVPGKPGDECINTGNGKRPFSLSPLTICTDA